MKITNYNIGWWIFGFSHIIPIILYFINEEAFIGTTLLFSGIWLFVVGGFIIHCLEGGIKFEIHLSLFSEKRRLINKAKKIVNRLKLDAIENIDNKQKYDEIIKQIADIELSLEKLK